jgi:REP element-mobilizing transposase RayT
VGAIIRTYKSTTARLINGMRHTPGIPVWQRNYYEHIVRDEAELRRIRQYIQDNPLHWEADQENSVKVRSTHG